MANGFTDYTESGVINHLLRTSTFAKPSTIAVALTSNVPIDSDTGVTMPEIGNLGAYARVDLGPPSDSDFSFVDVNNAGGSGQSSNLAAITFPAATSNWGFASGIALLDSSTHSQGNLLWYGALDTPKDITTGDQLEISVGSLQVFLS